MSLKIVVLAKQVPDTRNVGKDAMTAEGTVNRAALPAIFNPRRFECTRASIAIERTISRFYRRYSNNGPSTCWRNIDKDCIVVQIQVGCSPIVNLQVPIRLQLLMHWQQQFRKWRC